MLSRQSICWCSCLAVRGGGYKVTFVQPCVAHISARDTLNPWWFAHQLSAQTTTGQGYSLLSILLQLVAVPSGSCMPCVVCMQRMCWSCVLHCASTAWDKPVVCSCGVGALASMLASSLACWWSVPPPVSIFKRLTKVCWGV